MMTAFLAPSRRTRSGMINTESTMPTGFMAEL